MFPLPKGKPEFSALEEAVLQYWKEFKIFEKSVELRSEKSPYRFYDGPPFITGTPHYGSLLSSIIKDVVPRYQTMRGKRVERVWGWDCHGLPIEQKVQKKLGLESNKAIEESEGGIQKFIDECYNYTNSTSAEWNWYVDHIGRWVDMEHAYRTMDQDYMESVMWVFKQIWERGYVYEGKRVSWYSWKLSTPISNFEIAMDDSYQDVQDPAVTIKFPITPRHCAFGWISDKQGRLLMGWNFKHNQWYFPGGKVEEGESPEACFIREAQEEIGVKFTPQDVKFEMQENRVITGCWNITHFSAKISADAVKNCEPDKFREWKWFTPEELEEVYPTVENIDRDIIDRFLGKKKITSQTASISLLAWTTTPWTLPMNMALAVNKDLTYVLVQSGEEQYVLAKSRVETVFKGKGEFIILEEFKGEELVSIEYQPPFPYYNLPLTPSKGGGIRTPSPLERDGERYRVYHADFVTDTDGTGIAHEAPEFGDVDFQLAKEHGIHITSAIDKEGKYTAEVPDYQGQLFLDAIDPICDRLKSEGTLFKKESITHRVPFCPRSNTQLMQKAQKSWFIDIARIKKELIEQNEKISWFPEHFKHGRFLNSLESAPDWCISRSRFWGTPMPVWQNEDGSERVVVSSREELYQLNKPLKQITKIIFVRHGESEGNLNGFIGTPETSLTKKGIEQAKEAGKKLREISIDSMIVSPFVRTQETAEYINTSLHLPMKFDERIVEWNVGKYFGQKRDEKWHTIRNEAEQNPSHKIDEDGESIEDMQIRAKSFIDDVVKNHTGETIVVVSHCDFGRALFSYLRGIHFVKQGKLLNAVPTTLYIDNNTGKELNLHRPTIDQINIPSSKTKKILKRIPEVLDVWMDSASMPYAQVHYPFENVDKMEASFPADFIAEYTGQIRAWFYVMHVLGVLVKGSPAYKNVVVTGVINGTDGRKMSKSYGNYPDPRDTILKYGADAIRFYLMSGPIMRGEDMNFSENGIQESIKRVILPLWNAYTFFATYANIDHWTCVQMKNEKGKMKNENTTYRTPKTNELDIWIISQLNTLITDIRSYMDSYDLQKTCEAIMVFLDGLNNWYIRRNRRRFWRAELDDDKKSAYETLHEVLVTLTQLLAPICPFISDYLYGCLTKDNSMIDNTIKERHNSNASDYRIIGLSDYPSSVHLTDFPEPNTKLINQKINQKMTDLQALTNLGLAVRGREKLRVRQPLRSATITLKLDKSTQAILAEELNVKEIHTISDVSEYVTITYSPDAKKIGATERKQWMKIILTEAKSGNGKLLSDGLLQITCTEAPGGKILLMSDEFETVYTPKEGSSIAFAGSAGYVIGLDVTLDEELTIEGYSRDLVRAIQDARKEMGFAVTDRLKLQLTSENVLLEEILKTHQTMIEKETLTTIQNTKDKIQNGKEVEIDEGFMVSMDLIHAG